MRDNRRTIRVFTLMRAVELPLRDIHLPEAIEAGEMAIGGWILLILISLILWFCYLLYKRMIRKTAIKTAKKQLKILKIDHAQTGGKKLKIMSALIRRVAISLDSRSDCAGLTGDAWLAYLDRSLGENAFSRGSGKILILGPYQKKTDVDIDALVVLTERWLKVQK